MIARIKPSATTVTVLLGTLPLGLQRRIVNDAIEDRAMAEGMEASMILSEAEAVQWLSQGRGVDRVQPA